MAPEFVGMDVTTDGQVGLDRRVVWGARLGRRLNVDVGARRGDVIGIED